MEKMSQKAFEKLLRAKLLRSGKLLPTTTAHLSKLGKKPLDTASLPDFLKDADALMARGYVAYSKLMDNQKERVNEPEIYTFAARNGEEISQESMQKIIKLIDENDEEQSRLD